VGGLISIATLFWQANNASRDFSHCYTPSWVEKLYRGFARNLHMEFEFLCFVDRPYEFNEPEIQQVLLIDPNPSYATCIEPYRLGVPMILVGLDTIVLGNVDGLARYCLEEDVIALPRDPFFPSRACNGVALVPGEKWSVYDNWNGENDMEWMRKQPHRMIDDIFPGQVVSYKGHVKKNGLGDARIAYFHGQEKPHQLGHLPWVKEHWR
jgi:hypothetical protein